MAADAGAETSHASELTREETDQQERSKERLFPVEPKRKGSYKAMLAGSFKEVEMEELLPADEDGFPSEVSNPEDDADDPYCPTILLSSSDKKRIYQRWKDTLIVKLLGKKVGYRFLYRTLMNQWRPKEEIAMADMGIDFYLFQFNNEYDFSRVLYDRPWIVADHVLVVRKSQPRFDPDEAVIDRVVV
ncbi:hypothetical protein Tsubulata_023131 [Turnera subulata]|uniref:DUF4283 domain-containing protein n=1 Tax=Turnera subulata TaxID=218843 RepID=A0A9Q0J0E9_9ROSI|nr:hypothetical protein Tsubulata_023131 [Turnera subulata]